MKKLITIIVLLFGLTMAVHAQTIWFRTTSFASAKVYNGNYYWGDWEKSNLSMSIDLDSDIITIYSQVKQIYFVTKCGETYIDAAGGKQLIMYVIDQDRDRGTLRLRTESNRNSQIYIDFNNIAWCYNVVRTN